MSRNSSIGGIFAELTLRDGKFSAGMKSAGAKLKAFGTAAGRYGAMAGAALAAGLGAGVKRIMAMGGELSDLSAQTGIAVADLMRIQQAYKDNGKAADSAAKDINKMQRAIFEASQDPGGSLDYFSQIGLDPAKLMGMNAADQFATVAEAINGIENQTKRAALAMDIFGRSGGELLTVFAGTDLESINSSLGKMPDIMQEFAAEMDHADDILSRLPNKADQFFTGFTAGVVGELIPSLETIDGFDFTNIGKSLGESLAGAIEHAAFLANVLFDTFSGEGYAESIAKYAAAQELIDQEQEQAAAERKKQAEEQKAYDAARRMEHMQAPDWVDPYEAARLMEHRTAPDYIDPETTKPAEIAPMVIQEREAPSIDDYQRRGLSLSSSPAEATERKQLTVLEQIEKILGRMEAADRELIF